MLNLFSKNLFPHYNKLCHTHIFTNRPVDDLEIKKIISITSFADTKHSRRTRGVSDDGRLFIKSSRVGSFTKSVRIAMGKPKPFDFFLHEISNNTAINRMKTGSPQLIGYAIRNNNLGLPIQTSLIFENLDDHVNANDYLEGGSADITQLIATCLTLLEDLHAKKIYHLDLWLGNIMISRANPTIACAIDYEHCFIGQPADIAMILGMQYGIFYFARINSHLIESEYDAIIRSRLPAEVSHSEAFWSAYGTAKIRDVKRMERRNVFLKGKF